MNFLPQSLDEIKVLNLQDAQEYTIEYLDKDYFNADEIIVKTKAKAMINDGQVSFVVTDTYGMDKFITKFRVIL